MQDIFERMQRIIADQFAVEPEEITEETSFEEDLGADSCATEHGAGICHQRGAGRGAGYPAYGGRLRGIFDQAPG